MATFINSPNVKTLVIKAGESGVLKSTARIISVGLIGNVDAESNCTNVDEAIANAESYECYEFVWETETAGAWEEGGVYMEAVELEGNSYEIEELISNIDQSPGIAGKIKQVVPKALMLLGDNVKGKAWYDQFGGGIITQAICFRAIPTVADKLRIKFRNNMANGNEGEDPVYYIYPRPISKTSAESGDPTWCTCVTTSINNEA